jgi:hypothetical protein
VVQHQELRHLALPGAESQPLAKGHHQLSPPDGVVATHPLPGVVQEHPQAQRERVRQVRHAPPQRRLHIHQIAGPQRVEPPQRAQGVNVDGVHVVQVALVVGGDAPELGNQRPQHTQGMHLVEHCAPTGG